MISREDIEAMQEPEIDYMYQHYEEEDQNWLDKCTGLQYAAIVGVAFIGLAGVSVWL